MPDNANEIFLNETTMDHYVLESYTVFISGALVQLAVQVNAPQTSLARVTSKRTTGLPGKGNAVECITFDGFVNSGVWNKSKAVSIKI